MDKLSNALRDEVKRLVNEELAKNKKANLDKGEDDAWYHYPEQTEPARHGFGWSVTEKKILAQEFDLYLSAMAIAHRRSRYSILCALKNLPCMSRDSKGV